MEHSLQSWILELVGGDYPRQPLALHQIAVRAVAVYLIGLALIRIGKSRIISRMSAFDVIVGFILGSLLSRGITGDASLSGTATACGCVVALHYLLTRAACHSHAFGKLIKGSTRLLIRDGRVIEENLLKSHLSRHDLEEQLRLQGVDDVIHVRQALKERNGEVSVIRNDLHRSQPHDSENGHG